VSEPSRGWAGLRAFVRAIGWLVPDARSG